MYKNKKNVQAETVREWDILFIEDAPMVVQTVEAKRDGRPKFTCIGLDDKTYIFVFKAADEVTIIRSSAKTK